MGNELSDLSRRSSLSASVSKDIRKSSEYEWNQAEWTKVQQKLDQLQSTAARAVQVRIRNLTSYVLHRNNQKLDHGMWTFNMKPPDVIPPLQNVTLDTATFEDGIVFGTQSNGIMTGTSGEVTYFTRLPTGGESSRFLLSWSNPFVGSNSTMHDCSPGFAIITDLIQTGNHFHVCFTVREKRVSIDGPTLSKERLHQLQLASCFDKEELRLLYKQFKQLAVNDELTKAQFVQLFPEFDSELVLTSLFNAFSTFSDSKDDNPDTVDFGEFVQVLSIMSRGSVEQKTALSFNIADLDKNGFVERDEVLQISSQLSSIMTRLGFDPESFGSAAEVVQNLFSKFTAQDSMTSEQIQAVKDNIPRESSGEQVADDEKDDDKPAELDTEKGLSQNEFLKRAMTDADFSECFGMFKYFCVKIVEPMERMLGNMVIGQIEYSGWLEKEKGDTIFNKSLQLVSKQRDNRYFVLRDGFLAYYKDVPDHKNILPINVLSLRYASVQEGLKNDLYLKLPNWSRTVFASSKQEKKKWVRAIRSNISGGYRFQSFAPVRENVKCQWFVNGSEYFRSLIPAILGATSTIFIADWYLSPGLYLSRDQPLNKDLRLDNLLLKMAKQGVRIYLIVWNASQLAFDLRASYVVDFFTKLHPNIAIIAHPHFKPVVWSHHQKFVVVDSSIAFVGGIDLCYNRYDNEKYLLVDPNEETYPGRDYGNLCHKGESNGPAKQPVIDRSKLPRMPWHDIMMQVTDSAAKDVASNFIERWNHAITSAPRGVAVPMKDGKPLFIMPGPIQSDKPRSEVPCNYVANCQILRSVGTWSAGIPKSERSIYKGYLSAIKNAKHFIYIENQYFISSINRARPKNRLLLTLYERLSKAITNEEEFRVVILIPVYPAGSLIDVATRYVIKYVYKTICRQGSSLMQMLRTSFPDVDLSKYISFYALRNHAKLDGKAVTEQVYIHAKMMLVDDRIAMIGSANINDRSMRGNRDSEICAYVDESEENMVDSVMAGKPFKVSRFVHELRMRLWRDYLGLPANDMSIQDPVCDQVFTSIWRTTARHNTELYKLVFQTLPDTIKSLSDIKEVNPRYPIEIFELLAYFEPREEIMLEKIKGFLVEFPMAFLEAEQMSPTIFDKEFVMPRYVFL